jgi:lactoylglutathione lyase
LHFANPGGGTVFASANAIFALRGPMKYLHTMGASPISTSRSPLRRPSRLQVTRGIENEKGRHTLAALAPPVQPPKARSSELHRGPEVYTGGGNFGHLAYEVDDIYATCDKLMKAGVTINRPPRYGNMAFVRSPDLHSIELLQKGEPKPPAEPWASMPNTGHW